MKKIALLLALLMFILPITANAAVTRNVNISPGLKIPRWQQRTGSSPVSGTIERMSILRHSFLIF